jgi:hypothetical protein
MKRGRTKTKGNGRAAKLPQEAEELVEAEREPFTVMRVVVPVSQKGFVYEQARKMGLDTPSAYVRLVLKDLKEHHEEFELERRGFGDDDELESGSSQRARGQGRSSKRARGRRR